MNIELNLDINEVVSEQIKSHVDNLNGTIKMLMKERDDLREELQNTKKEQTQKDLESKKADTAIALVNKIKNQYDSIVATPETYDKSKRSKAKNKQEFIKDLLYTHFGLKPTLSHGLRTEYLWIWVAKNYYDNKDEVLSLLSLIESESFCQKVRNFKEPKDYSIDKIIEFVDNPHSCPNGMYMVAGWEYVGGSKPPHSMYFENDYIRKDSVFERLVDNVQNQKRGEYKYLYGVTGLSDHQKEKLGRTLIDNDGYRLLDNKNVKKFISDGLKENTFDEDTVNYLYKFIDDKQKSTFYFQYYPRRYQEEFLKQKGLIYFLQVSNTLKWNDEDKESFVTRMFK